MKWAKAEEAKHKEKAHTSGPVARTTGWVPLESRTVARPLCVLNTWSRASHTVRAGDAALRLLRCSGEKWKTDRQP